MSKNVSRLDESKRMSILTSLRAGSFVLQGEIVDSSNCESWIGDSLQKSVY
jgi:hypothetical protein